MIVFFHIHYCYCYKVPPFLPFEWTTKGMLERVNMFLEKLVSEDSVVTRELAAIIYRGLSPI